MGLLGLYYVSYYYSKIENRLLNLQDQIYFFDDTIENENETKKVHSDELNYPTNLNKWIKICFMLEFED